MKLPVDYVGKMEKLCSKEESRFALTHLYLDVAAKILCGTDGHIIGCVPVEIEDGETSGLVPADTLKRMVAGRKRNPVLRCGPADVVLTFDDGECVTYPRPTGIFPSYAKVIPKRKGPPTISLNANLLVTLAQAVSGGGAIDLWIHGNDGGVLIGGSLSTFSGFGCIMPMRTGNTEPPKMPTSSKVDASAT